MKDMIVAIAIIALLGFGYWQMGQLDHYLFHTKIQRNLSSRVLFAGKKWFRKMKRHFAALRQAQHNPRTRNISRRPSNRSSHTPYAI